MRTSRSTGLVCLATASCLDALTVQRITPKRRDGGTENIPAPIVVPPSQLFDGVDGSWSSFIVRVGTPAQSMRVLASTNSPATYVVVPEGCLEAAMPQDTVPQNCASARGGTFQSNLSTTWDGLGWFHLNDNEGHGFEANLGFNFLANYGLDKLGLGFEDADAPVLEDQTIGGFQVARKAYMGFFGLGTQSVIYDTYGNTTGPSYFESLHQKGLIPSLSWSYTAGARYRFSAGQYAQLIFGGYDPSRYQPNDLNFRLSADVTRDIVVGIQAIVYSGETTAYLLPDPIYAFIESTDPNIWLPLSACLLFEEAFGLTYDDTTQKYLMNDTQIANLLQKDISVTFRIAAGTTGGSTVDISIPFKAFGLKAQYPYVPNSTYYFPLQRAANNTQYTLGRAFLQEAYLTVDYERGNFSVSQCKWIDGAQSQVESILSSSYSTNHTSNSTSSTVSKGESKGVQAGPVVGGVLGGLGVLSVACIVFWWYRRKKQSSEPDAKSDHTMGPVPLEDLKHPDADKIFCTDAESEKGSMYKKAASIYTTKSQWEGESEFGASGHEIHQLSAETKATELGDTDTGIRHELHSPLPVELAGDHSYFGPSADHNTRGSGDTFLHPLRHQSSTGSVSSSSALLTPKGSPLLRAISTATARTDGSVVSPIDTPILSPRIESFAALHDRPAG